MSLALTLALLAAGLGLSGFCAWYERRPKELGDVRLFPATMFMAVGVILVILALAHLVTLITGVPLKGRQMF